MEVVSPTPVTVTEPGPAPAPVRARSYLRLFWWVAFIGIFLDQGSKYGIFFLRAHVWESDHVPVLRGSIKFDLVAHLFDQPDPKTHPLWFLRTLSTDRLHYVNQGALFGFMGGLSPATSNLIFAVISVSAAIGIIFWTSLSSLRRDRLLCFTLGLVFAGAVGNLYDRAIFGGVRDFLHFYDLPLPFGLDNWPVFNVADVFLVCGATLLVLEAALRSPEPASETPAKEASAA